MARHWAGIRPPAPPPRVDDQIVAAMRRYGAPPEDIAAAEARAAEAEQDAAGEDDCEIWAENVESWEAFQQVATQWTYAGMGGQRTGLNYAGVESFLRITAHPRQVRARFLDIQVIERAVLEADQELHPAKET